MSYTGTDPYGVRATAGTLITCDSAAKQIIMHLDKQRPGSDKFILNDFREGDDTHVLIKTAYVDELRAAVQNELEKNTYVQDQV